MAALFACTRCNSRHPFEDLSQGQQLCKDCRGAFPVVKCTYCRTEFQQDGNIKGSTVSVCKKCEQNVKSYGKDHVFITLKKSDKLLPPSNKVSLKPAACEYCNIIAAFIGSKCQRCTNSEKKYGPPLTCEQCKQRCAFDRKDDSRKKVDGKLLCWLCTLSYKRALAKAKQNSPVRHSSSSSLHKTSGNHHRTTSSSSQNHKHSLPHSSNHKSSDHPSPNKKLRTELNKSANGNIPSSESTFLDPNSSDHVVAITQLKEQVALLQKQLSQKDQQMISKDKQMTELKAHHSRIERELREKIQQIQKQNTDQIQEMQVKLRNYQKQIATLSKSNKKGNTDSPQAV